MREPLSGGRKAATINGWDGNQTPVADPPEVAPHRNGRDTRKICRGGIPHEMHWVSYLAPDNLRFPWERQVCARCGKNGRFRSTRHPARAERFLRTKDWLPTDAGEQCWKRPDGRIYLKQDAVRIASSQR